MRYANIFRVTYEWNLSEKLGKNLIAGPQMPAAAKLCLISRSWEMRKNKVTFSRKVYPTLSYPIIETAGENKYFLRDS